MKKSTRSTPRIVHHALDVKGWLAAPPSVASARPGSCVDCGAASQPTGGLLGLHGHGFRDRQLRGPLDADSAPKWIVHGLPLGGSTTRPFRRFLDGDSYRAEQAASQPRVIARRRHNRTLEVSPVVRPPPNLHQETKSPRRDTRQFCFWAVSEAFPRSRGRKRSREITQVNRSPDSMNALPVLHGSSLVFQ